MAHLYHTLNDDMTDRISSSSFAKTQVKKFNTAIYTRHQSLRNSNCRSYTSSANVIHQVTVVYMYSYSQKYFAYTFLRKILEFCPHKVYIIWHNKFYFFGHKTCTVRSKNKKKIIKKIYLHMLSLFLRVQVGNFEVTKVFCFL